MESVRRNEVTQKFPHPRPYALTPGLNALVQNFIDSFPTLQRDDNSPPGEMAVQLQEQFIYLTRVYKGENSSEKNSSLTIDIFAEDIIAIYNLLREHPKMTDSIRHDLEVFWNEDPHIFLKLGIESIKNQGAVPENEVVPASSPQMEKNIRRFREIPNNCYEYDSPSREQLASMTEAQFFQLEDKEIQDVFHHSDLTLNQILNLSARQFHDIKSINASFKKDCIGRVVFSTDQTLLITDILNLTDIQRKVIFNSDCGLFLHLFKGELKIKQALQLTLEQAAFIREQTIQSYFSYQLLTVEEVFKQIINPQAAINQPFIKQLIESEKLTKLQALQLSVENCAILCSDDLKKDFDSGTLLVLEVHTKITNSKSAFNSEITQKLIRTDKLARTRALALNPNQEQALLLNGKRALRLSAADLESFFEEHSR